MCGAAERQEQAIWLSVLQIARTCARSQVNADADLMFSLLSDPFQHERIFKAIEVGGK